MAEWACKLGSVMEARRRSGVSSSALNDWKNHKKMVVHKIRRKEKNKHAYDGNLDSKKTEYFKNT